HGTEQRLDFWTLHLQLTIVELVGLLPSSGKIMEEKANGAGETEGTEDPRRARTSKTTEQSSYELTETEAASAGPAQVETRKGVNLDRRGGERN
ncbi:hypothetical protein LEMLEM_LOCUS10344, partial [Lemmus lemmus]